jgi:hypothetical protein
MNNDFYYCYSTKLHDFLRENGVRYICAGLNENTLRKFWQYRRSDELNGLLAQWNVRKPVI